MNITNQAPVVAPGNTAEAGIGIYGCARCAKRWTGYNMSHCGECCETFTGVTAFDAHRAGSLADGTRHCLPPETVRDKHGQPRLVPAGRNYPCWGLPGSNPRWLDDEGDVGAKVRGGRVSTMCAANQTAARGIPVTAPPRQAWRYRKPCLHCGHLKGKHVKALLRGIGGREMSAPGYGTQPSSNCVNCGRSNCWYEPGCKHCGYDFWTGRVGGGGYAEVREYLCTGCDCPKYRCDRSRRKCCPDCRHTGGAVGLVDAR